MPRRRFLTLLVRLAVLASVAVSCGGESPTTDRASPTDHGSTTTGPTTAPSTSPTPTTPTPTTPRWRQLPDAPIEGRIAAGAVWTGREMLIWGGVGRSMRIAELGDGAAYDPVSREWRMLPPAPKSVAGVVGSAAAWTGREAVFWAGNAPDGPAVGAVYDPVDDAWRRLEPGPLGPRDSSVSAWTGREMLIAGGTNGDGFANPVAAAVDPGTLQWRPLRALNALGAFIPTGAVWAEDRLFLTGRRYLCPELGSTCQDSRPLFLAYDLASDVAEPVDTSGAPVGERAIARLAPVGWTGTELVLWTPDQPLRPLLLYDPETASWRMSAASTCTAHGGFHQHAWLGDRLAVACGTDAVAVYDIENDAWQTISAGPSPFNDRFDSAIVWTGSRLIVWSGGTDATGNPTPADGAELRLRG